jgi:hypothetical protein
MANLALLILNLLTHHLIDLVLLILNLLTHHLIDQRLNPNLALLILNLLTHHLIEPRLNRSADPRLNRLKFLLALHLKLILERQNPLGDRVNILLILEQPNRHLDKPRRHLDPPSNLPQNLPHTNLAKSQALLLQQNQKELQHTNHHVILNPRLNHLPSHPPCHQGNQGNDHSDTTIKLSPPSKSHCPNIDFTTATIATINIIALYGDSLYIRSLYTHNQYLFSTPNPNPNLYPTNPNHMS